MADRYRPGVAAIRRKAFVTGASRNIGRAVALELARRGMDLALVGHSDGSAMAEVAARCRDHAVNVVPLIGDIGTRSTCDSLVETAMQGLGGFDVLVLCAAVRPRDALLDTTESTWTRVMDVNLNSAFWLVQALLPNMLSTGWGRIIGFTGLNSMSGAQNPAVAASKYGQLGLMRSIGKEFAGKGITANILSPGPTSADDEAADTGYDSPRPRRGTPADIAALVGFLVSDEAGHISGQMIAVDGGRG